MRKFRIIALLLGAAIVGLLAVGCGSSDSTTGSSDEGSLTKAEFVKQGNAICAQGSKDLNAEFEEFTKENGISETKAPPKDVQEEAVEEILIPSVSRQIDEVKALGTPEGDEGEVEELIAAEEEVVEEAEENPLALLEGGSAKEKEANKLATDYGLTVCGSEG
jgi:hypothetical protein